MRGNIGNMKKKHKKGMGLFVVLVLAAALGFGLSQTDMADTVIRSVTSRGGLGTETLCYSVGRSDSNEDIYALKMDVVRGETVSGEIALIPFERDIKAGEFRGEVTELNEANGLWKADLIWTALAEGMVEQEQLFIQFNRDAALIGFGVKEQDETGRYVYTNPDEVTYSVAVPASPCSGAEEALN